MLLAICTVTSCFASALDRGIEAEAWATDVAIRDAVRMVSQWFCVSIESNAGVIRRLFHS